MNQTKCRLLIKEHLKKWWGSKSERSGLKKHMRNKHEKKDKRKKTQKGKLRSFFCIEMWLKTKTNTKNRSWWPRWDVKLRKSF